MKTSHAGNQYTGKYWTDERKEKLRKVWFSGMPIDAMARHYGVRPDTIYAWCSRRFKFGRRFRSSAIIDRDPEKVKVFRRNYPHMSDATLAAYFGVSKDCVRDTARRMGLTKTEQLHRDEIIYKQQRSVESRLINKMKAV